MTRVGLIACYAGVLASVATPKLSSALSLRSATESSQESRDGFALFISIEQTAPKADDKTDECLTIINTMRTGAVKGLLEALTKAQDNEVTESLKKLKKEGEENTTAKTIAAKLAGTDATTCDSAASANAETYPGLVIPFAYDTKFDCNALIEETYTAGLSHLKESRFDPSTGKYDINEVPFNNVAASNVAFLMSSKSTKVSCAATKDCTGGHNILFCYFVEPLQNGEAPFTTELYNALWETETGAASISVPSAATGLLSLALILLT
ncbi:SAG family member [Eimeria necatrix]|uniref:SAG family member n=1 Tax=Eimeria necatrix TaxID=51315 RepID=U6MDV6_9EIME|nr:SAG family member [Eimeria necatrix]CDJ62191.1 SAG family member [Eimeria necatrix]